MSGRREELAAMTADAAEDDGYKTVNRFTITERSNR